MYLARTDSKGTSNFTLRESFRDTGTLQYRDLFTLGPDPSRFIRYPGGNAYYFDESLIEALEAQGVADAEECLDDLLWRFLKPELQRILRHFRHSGKVPRKPAPEEPATIYHLFDRRRILFLKTGTLDQGRVGRLPGKLFRVLSDKSRDEIEQHFLAAEQVLKPHEFKTYAYVIFDLATHFTSPLARRFPAAMDEIKMDLQFIKAICRLHADRDFWGGLSLEKGLPAYLVRYVVMYFDNAFPDADLSSTYVQDFMRSRRRFRFPDKARPVMNMADASRILGLSPDQARKMSRRELTRYYRKMALKLHPDQGGDPDQFINITEAFQAALNNRK